jgi:hypothetical protein
MTESNHSLELSEREDLAACEATIHASLSSFGKLGSALAIIHLKRLYRETHPSFEAYCTQRWGISKVHAHRLIQGAGVYSNLLPAGNAELLQLPMPQSEAQVRPLTKLAPEQQREAWAKAVEKAPEGRLTAKHVEAAVKDLLGASEELHVTGSDEQASLPAVPGAESKATSSLELYTPKVYIEAVREVLGEIDLDPASSEEANRTVRAKTFYSSSDGGLRQAWSGRVFLAPPATPGKWSSRLLDFYGKRIVSEAVLLVNADIVAEWFKPLWGNPICFTDHRICFKLPGGEDWPAKEGQAFVYLGSNVEEFARVFRRFGHVVTLYA